MRQAKYGHFMLPVVFSDKEISDIGFTDEAVVHCDVSVAKMLLWVMVMYK